MDSYLHKARKEDFTVSRNSDRFSDNSCGKLKRNWRLLLQTFKHDSNGISNGNAVGDGKKSFNSYVLPTELDLELARTDLLD